MGVSPGTLTISPGDTRTYDRIYDYVGLDDVREVIRRVPANATSTMFEWRERLTDKHLRRNPETYADIERSRALTHMSPHLLPATACEGDDTIDGGYGQSNTTRRRQR